MATNVIQGLISEIFQYAQVEASRAAGPQKPSSQGEALFQKAGQTAQSYLFGQAAKTIESELTGLFADKATEKATEAVAANAAPSVMSKAATALAGVAGVAYGGYELVKNWGTRNPIGGAISGATMGAGAVALGSTLAGGAMAGAWAGPIGMAVGAVIGGAIGFIKAGKHADQKIRDNVRDMLQQQGTIDENYTIGLADGSRYDIGIDGGPKAEFNNLRPYEIDLNREGIGDVIGLVNPFMTVLAGGNQKIQSDFTGYFVNAAMSNANGDIEVAKQNVLAIFSQLNMKPEDVVGGLVNLAQNGKLPEDHLQAMLGGFRDLLSDDPYVLKAPVYEPASENMAAASVQQEEAVEANA